MNREEKSILDDLKNMVAYRIEMEQLEEKLAGKGYGTTQNINPTGITGGFGQGSKVESYCIGKMTLEERLWRLKANIAIYYNALDGASLTEQERDIILHLIKGGSMASYSRQNSIYHTYAYKIRDRAIRKIYDFMKKRTNDANNRVII